MGGVGETRKHGDSIVLCIIIGPLLYSQCGCLYRVSVGWTVSGGVQGSVGCGGKGGEVTGNRKTGG